MQSQSNCPPPAGLLQENLDGGAAAAPARRPAAAAAAAAAALAAAGPVARPKAADGGRKGCNCKRSMCLKMYCECFAAGAQARGARQTVGCHRVHYRTQSGEGGAQLSCPESHFTLSFKPGSPNGPSWTPHRSHQPLPWPAYARRRLLRARVRLRQLPQPRGRGGGGAAGARGGAGQGPPGL